MILFNEQNYHNLYQVETSAQMVQAMTNQLHRKRNQPVNNSLVNQGFLHRLEACATRVSSWVLFAYVPADFRRVLKFCFHCNQLKFQLADNPGLFNRKPITENRKRYYSTPLQSANFPLGYMLRGFQNIQPLAPKSSEALIWRRIRSSPKSPPPKA